MPRPDPSSSPRGSSGGYTLMEVLVAIAILSALGFGVWMSVSGSHRLLARVSALDRGSRQVLLLDAALRAELARIRPPFWLGAPPVAVSASSACLELTCLGGEPDALLRVVFEDRFVRIVEESAQGRVPLGSFGPFESVTCEFVRAEGAEDEKEDRPGGFRFTVTTGEPSEEGIELFVTPSSHPFYLGGLP